ncbi:DUF1499 domain-containing protein [Enhydrobacter sp.]|jgi:uncharacterized protein (DUF1499 family)|uniref:DUF1499 domain-containing protein n=1 Tax=Enhydrobacter sp. TaxID=1894999 RepID=UPI00262A69EA|nr:DUF1499 domain-containing protein [Enhydrobacter sp.]WIM11010.1 MAG: hypothetical protein OJF58_001967 [Enhydrobacter sp.]
MIFRPTNPISHRLARLAFALACLSAPIVAIAGPLHHYLGVDRELALNVFRFGFYIAAASIALALATILPTRPGDRRRGFVAAVLALVIGVAAAWAPLAWLMHAYRAPDLTDITTDTENPPKLVVTLQLRRGATNAPAYPGHAAAELQHAIYPDLTPIRLNVPPAEAFRRVERVAAALGWQVVARVPAEGRLEAVATSPWFGFHDDIVVRIRRDGASSSRVDIRSKSRTGTSDLGVNAERIRTFARLLLAER